jgi:hypothetical protein
MIIEKIIFKTGHFQLYNCIWCDFEQSHLKPSGVTHFHVDIDCHVNLRLDESI